MKDKRIARLRNYDPSKQSLSEFRMWVKNVKQVALPDAVLSCFDMQDLYVLSYLGKGFRISDVAKILTLSMPAISQRLNRMSAVLGFEIREVYSSRRSTSTTTLTPLGARLCGSIDQAIMHAERVFKEVIIKSETMRLSKEDTHAPAES